MEDSIFWTIYLPGFTIALSVATPLAIFGWKRWLGKISSLLVFLFVGNYLMTHGVVGWGSYHGRWGMLVLLGIFAFLGAMTGNVLHNDFFSPEESKRGFSFGLRLIQVICIWPIMIFTEALAAKEDQQLRKRLLYHSISGFFWILVVPLVLLVFLINQPLYTAAMIAASGLSILSFFPSLGFLMEKRKKAEAKESVLVESNA